MVQQLLHYNSGCTKVLAPPAGTDIPSPEIIAAPGTAWVSSGTNFFYSNNPEDIDTNGLADNGYWLLKEDVFGAGRVFMWHKNIMTSPINEELLIFNPNTFAIVVSSAAAVIPPGNGIDLWYRFFQGGGPSITIPAGQFGALFRVDNIQQNVIYGVVADISITDTTLTIRATAVLYDLAWRLNPGGATMQAAAVGPQVRGLGDGYTIFTSLNPVYVLDALRAPQGFTIAATFDSFNGTDVPRINAPPPEGQFPLQGCYGAWYYAMTWAVINNDDLTRTITFYAGNNSSTDRTNFAIKTGYTLVDGGFGGCGIDTPPPFVLLPGQYVPFLQAPLAPSIYASGYTFTIMTIGGYSTPLTICMGAS